MVLGSCGRAEGSSWAVGAGASRGQIGRRSHAARHSRWPINGTRSA